MGERWILVFAHLLTFSHLLVACRGITLHPGAAAANADLVHAGMNPGASSFSRAVISQPGRLWSGYLGHLERHPVLTKTFTSAVATILGDALAQYTSKAKEMKEWRYDWLRTARFTVFQGALMGPVGHFYYQLLDGSVMPTSAKSPAAVAAKVVIDQLVFAPICTVVFYLWKCFSEGRPRTVTQELREKYIPTMVANWKLWPAAHIINFALVPPSQRILYANVVSVLGVYILSKAAAGDLTRQRMGGRQRMQRAPAARLPSRQLQQQEEGAAPTLVIKHE